MSLADRDARAEPPARLRAHRLHPAPSRRASLPTPGERASLRFALARRSTPFRSVVRWVWVWIGRGPCNGTPRAPRSSRSTPRAVHGAPRERFPYLPRFSRREGGSTPPEKHVAGTLRPLQMPKLLSE